MHEGVNGSGCLFGIACDSWNFLENENILKSFNLEKKKFFSVEGTIWIA